MNKKNELSIALIQTSLVWEDYTANIQHIHEQIISLPKEIDLIVLPEMFTTGFTMRPEIFEDTIENDTHEHLLKWAQLTGAAICGSHLVKFNSHYFNRFVWVEPNGNKYFYDKAHLFRMGEEQLHYQKGNKRLIVHYKGWKIAPFICYDLRFPVWIRKTKEFDYDLLLFVANWPEKRIAHWKALTLARAIENQAYVIAVNRVGKDGNDIYHSGDTCLISPLGEVLYAVEHEAANKILSISYDTLEKYKESFPVGLDADKFEIS
jgi:predicted amidohydrolase